MKQERDDRQGMTGPQAANVGTGTQEPTHTPGPWSVQTNGDGSLSIAGGVSPDPITNARYLWVADVKRTQNANPMWRQEEESEANARLMAAAPDLYEAVLAFLRSDLHNAKNADYPVILAMREAVTKARGGKG